MAKQLMRGDNNDGSEWDRASCYEKQERHIEQVRRIEILGAADVVFFRGPSAQLVVASEKQEGITRLKTRIQGDTLLIEQEGNIVTGGNIHVRGSGNIVINGSGSRFSYRSGLAGANGDAGFGCHAIVGIVLPEAPAISVSGSADVALYGLEQATLEVSIQGSGDVCAYGQVKHLEVSIAGSGDVDAVELIAAQANLLIAGSGDIDAYVTQSVKARVAGSGDILIRGNPVERDQLVAGSGKIKFKK